MVQAIVDLSDNSNYILNLIKAKYNLKDKSSAIDRLAEEYALDFLEFELRPEYAKRLQEIRKGEKIKVKDVKAYFSSMRE